MNSVHHNLYKMTLQSYKEDRKKEGEERMGKEGAGTELSCGMD